MANHARALAFNLLLGQVLGLLSYGVFLVTLTMSMYYLLRKPHTLNKVIAGAGTLLFCLITAQIVIETIAMFVPLLTQHTNQDTATTIDLANESYLPMNTAWLAIHFSTIFVSNLLMVYRVWIVFQRKWIVIALPGLGLAASLIFSGLLVAQNSRALVGSHKTDFGGVNFLIVTSSFDVFINIWCSVLLAYKVWLSQRYLRGTTAYLRSFYPLNVVIILIESAAIYTAVTFIALVTYATDSYVAYVFLQLQGIVPGITYSLVIIRFGMGGAFKAGPQLSTFAIPTPAPAGQVSRRENVMRLRPMAVNARVDNKTEATGISNGSVSEFEDKLQAEVGAP